MQCNDMQCSDMRCDEIQCNDRQCNAMTLHVIACIALHVIALLSLHGMSLHCMSLRCMSLPLNFTGNEPYTVFAQHGRVTLLAARFVIYLLNMLAKLKGDKEISTNTPILPISK